MADVGSLVSTPSLSEMIMRLQHMWLCRWWNTLVSYVLCTYNDHQRHNNIRCDRPLFIRKQIDTQSGEQKGVACMPGACERLNLCNEKEVLLFEELSCLTWGKGTSWGAIKHAMHGDNSIYTLAVRNAPWRRNVMTAIGTNLELLVV